jgi:plastocyanin
MRVRSSLGAAVMGLAGLAAACGGSKSQPSPTPNPTPGPGQESIVITIPSSDGYGESSFAPGSVTVAVGRTVVWENRDTFLHTTTAEGGQWNANMNPNGSYSRTFTAAGTFNYRCTVHQSMSGTVTVQ